MLILCPECGHKVSDKAVSCPECGFPIVKTSILSVEQEKPLIKANARAKRKRRKLPNGFGSIQKLSGKRTHPFAAYPPIKEFSEKGSPIRQKAIGYYLTWFDAFDALSEYNKMTDAEREERNQKLLSMSITFEELYDLYYKAKFKKELENGTKASMMVSMASAFKNSHALHKKAYASLRKDDFQDVLDNCPLKYSSKELIMTLFRQMAAYALENDYIEKDYSHFAHLPGEDDDENGIPFTESELKTLWADSSDPVTQIILIMSYTGFRIAAFNNIEIHKDGGYFVGGVKTKHSKCRAVPFHSKIAPFISEHMFDNFRSRTFREKRFYPKLAALGIAYTADGVKHTPHDCRHTFSWLCDRYTVDDVSKHLLMGHKLKGDVEKMKYSHRSVEELKDAIERIGNPQFLRSVKQ